MYIMKTTNNQQPTTNNQQPTTNNQQRRNIYVDLLRIAATFGVIIIHVASSKWYDTPIESFNWKIVNFYHTVIRWPVPIFVMISGIFFLRPLNEEIEFKYEIKKIAQKIIRIVFAITFWGILYNSYGMVGKYVINKEMFTAHDVIKIPGIIIFGPAWYHLWYLYMIIGLYLLTPIFRRFIKTSKKEHIEYFLILYFIGTCLPLFNTIIKHIPIFKGRILYFSLPEMSGYIGYFIAGYYFSNYEIKNKTKIGIYVMASISLLCTLLGTLIISEYTKEPNQYLVGALLPNTILITFGVFLLFKRIYSKIKLSKKQEKIIMDISKNTFGIYLIHALIISIFGFVGINPLIINPIISIPIISIIVMIVSYIGTIIIRKIPKINEYII